MGEERRDKTGDATDRVTVAAAAPSWDAVLLVCRECRKRSNGPREPKPKELAQALKRSAREERPRPRVLLTNCLGLCPKRATAIARVGGESGGARIAAVTTIEGAERAMGR